MENYDDIDIQKAKATIKNLLLEDVKAYKKFIPDIEKMDDVSFNKLFNGKKDHKYDIKDKSQYQFENLIDKFNNFSFLLNEWYDAPEYLPYLKEIWSNYIVMEDLAGKDDIVIEQKLKPYGINYRNWSFEAKKSFKKAFNNTKNSFVSEEDYRERVKKLPAFWNSFINELTKFANFCFSQEQNGLGELINKYKIRLIGDLLQVTGKNFNLLKNVVVDLYKGLKSNFSIVNAIDTFKKNLVKYKDTIKECYSSKISIAMHGFMTLLNVYSTITQYYKIKSYTDDIPIYKDRLKETYSTFIRHKEEISIILNLQNISIREMNIIIDGKVKDIQNDKNEIIKLIAEITESINRCKEIKSEETGNLVSSIIQTCFGIIGGIATGGVTAGIYYTSSVINALSSIGHGVNINNCIDTINDLNKVLLEAKEKEKEIDKEIERLKEFFKENKEILPNYF